MGDLAVHQDGHVWYFVGADLPGEITLATNMNGDDTEPDWLQLLGQLGPDRLDPQAGEAEVREEQDQVGLGEALRHDGVVVGVRGRGLFVIQLRFTRTLPVEMKVEATTASAAEELVFEEVERRVEATAAERVAAAPGTLGPGLVCDPVLIISPSAIGITEKLVSCIDLDELLLSARTVVLVRMPFFG